MQFLSTVISFSPMVAWLLAALVGVIFVIISFVLSYHWKRFGIETYVMAKASFLYFSVSAILLVLMVVSLAVYLGSI